ncbi:transcriptional regulator with AbiEi antitoxin domain of type IV toxin-antitoxin system [Kribbella sp. VKM Ac-2527]|uniref:Transcriptional regulator with AbiEi antitoxin domain of type IV toxin-antitoxin system n=2 Tax=Kribbella caucasensis TaxID=2512215 RepID=A0A4R6JFX4_9ACTN|nr:transcriptional regulator with AbiEi antitoxin domain of type IV toxin-antitoxin system [Kribbella sp. VKM Ac-2527]
MESAASVLGFAQRIPEQEVVALPDNERFPKALAGDWRYVRIELQSSAIATVNGLPSWTLEGLLVGIAARPSAYKDVAGLGQWLAEAAPGVDTANVVELLQPMGNATRQRAAYLLAASDSEHAAAAIVEAYPPSEIAWLGPREAGGFFDSNTKVNDTLLFNYLSIGTGS